MYEEDFEWLRLTYKGKERANFVFDRLTQGDFVTYRPKEALTLLQEVIELGLKEAKVYIEKCNAHFSMSNYGLALDSIEEALSLADNYDVSIKIRILKYRGCILARMGKYKEARESYYQVMNLRHDDDIPVTRGFYSPYPDRSTMLFGYGLAQEFGEQISFAEKVALKALIFDSARMISSFELKGENSKKVVSFRTYVDYYEENYPGITDIFREIVGEESWQAIMSDTRLIIHVAFPSISEALPDGLVL